MGFVIGGIGSFLSETAGHVSVTLALLAAAGIGALPRVSARLPAV